MSLDNLSAEDQRKLTEFIDKGVAIRQEVADLQDSLKDTAKSLAENWDLKPTVLMKAVNAAFKQTLQASKDEIDDVETILQYAKRI
jgi:hypothetical protein